MVKDYNQILYDILKPLKDEDIPLYLNTCPEDEDSMPSDFVVYRTGIVDSVKAYGDGKTLIRSCECDILVNEYGSGNYANSGTLERKVEQLLIEHDISYIKYRPGVEQKSNSVQVNFTFSL